MATTITLNSKSKYLRKTATRDNPEFGIVKGQIVYYVRSSANDNSYYPVVWSYEQIKWVCPCGDCVHRHHQCKHCKVASEASRKYAARPKKVAPAYLPAPLTAGNKARLVKGKITIVDVQPAAPAPSAEFLKNAQAIEKGTAVLSSVFAEVSKVAA